MGRVMSAEEYERRYLVIHERECRRRQNEETRRWQAAHPEKMEEYRQKNLKANMTPEAWSERMEKQRERRRRDRELESQRNLRRGEEFMY